MNTIVFTEQMFDYMKSRLWNEQNLLESSAIIFMNFVEKQGSTRFLVREVVIVPPEAYEVRTDTHIQFSSVFVGRMTKRAINAKQQIGIVHTHPFDNSSFPQFSETDDKGEELLAHFFKARTGTNLHVSIVLSKTGVSARNLGGHEALAVTSIGTSVQLLTDFTTNHQESCRYDRQIRAFGREGQQILNGLHIGVVGVGGTGSAVTQSLALLGVRSFCLIDPDIVNESNLNRLIGATYSDVNLPKVEVVSRMIRSIQADADIRIVQGDVTSLSVSKELINMDFIFCCTDSHGSRAVLNQIAYQYLIPTIDMGVSIRVQSGEVSHITGRIQMLSPGLGCLVCGNLLDSDQVRWDFMHDYERKKDPYFLGEGEPAPSVVTLNMTVASFATSMFLGAMVGVPIQARHQVYDGIKGTVRSVHVPPVGGCVICSSSGMLGRGNEFPLIGRND